MNCKLDITGAELELDFNGTESSVLSDSEYCKLEIGKDPQLLPDHDAFQPSTLAVSMRAS